MSRDCWVGVCRSGQIDVTTGEERGRGVRHGPSKTSFKARNVVKQVFIKIVGIYMLALSS